MRMEWWQRVHSIDPWAFRSGRFERLLAPGKPPKYLAHRLTGILSSHIQSSRCERPKMLGQCQSLLRWRPAFLPLQQRDWVESLSRQSSLFSDCKMRNQVYHPLEMGMVF